ncbi:TonB-dependent receptor [Alkalilimnicola ehrlichii]|uniref:TonB-dependent receptor n=1 Tax=Alkalilimnicola ehrlichii TaxID=351052 RepID=UPI001C6E5A33|nr:TonB-dependent receptor [Alkalilimnicola ehrlichii]
MPGSLALGVAGEWRKQQGFVRNIGHGGRTDDRERWNGRVTAHWTPGEHSDAVLRYTRSQYRDGGAPWGPAEQRRRRVRSGTDSHNDSRGSSLSLNASHVFSDALRLRSVTAHNRFDDRIAQDLDFTGGGAVGLERNQRFDILSQELRLEGDIGTARWLWGAYADREDHTLRFRQRSPMGEQRMASELDGETMALFGQWIQPLGERWLLTPGLRAERSTVALEPEGAERRQERWNRVTPSLALQYRWRPESWLYARYAEGFRAGGFNAYAGAAGYPDYAPEKVASYELGAKGWGLDERLRYDLALYWMDVRDMHVQEIVQPGTAYITNAASARSAGLELELAYFLNDAWMLRSGLALNRTRFRTFQDLAEDYRGNSNPFAPDLAGFMGIRYEALTGWFAQADLSGMSRIYLDAANQYSRPGFGLLDLAGGYRHRHFTVTLYADNVTDTRYDAVGLLNGNVRVYSPPRELGLRLGMEF